jgi:hypothetical protein
MKKTDKVKEYKQKMLDFESDIPFTGRPVSIEIKEKPALNYFKTILENHNLLCLGEYQNKLTNKAWLVRNIDALAELGLEAIGLEFLENDRHQAILDNYIFNQEDTYPIPAEAIKAISENCLPLEDLEWTDNYDHSYVSPENLLAAAHSKGIRIVALENDISSSLDNEDTDRFRIMNFAAYENIKKEIINKENISRNPYGKRKAIILTKATQTPGLARYFDVPGIIIKN